MNTTTEPVPGYFERLKERRAGRPPLTAADADEWFARFGYRGGLYYGLIAKGPARPRAKPTGRTRTTEERPELLARFVAYRAASGLTYRAIEPGAGVSVGSLQRFEKTGEASDWVYWQISDYLDRVGAPE